MFYSGYQGRGAIKCNDTHSHHRKKVGILEYSRKLTGRRKFMPIDEEINSPTVEELGIIEPLTHAVRDVGYETPTPIQIKTIPTMLAVRDVIGQAPTGTGK